MSGDTNSKNWILGLNFFQDYLVKFEMPVYADNNVAQKVPRVGIYKSKHYGQNNHSKALATYA